MRLRFSRAYSTYPFPFLFPCCWLGHGTRSPFFIARTPVDTYLHITLLRTTRYLPLYPQLRFGMSDIPSNLLDACKSNSPSLSTTGDCRLGISVLRSPQRHIMSFLRLVLLSSAPLYPGNPQTCRSANCWMGLGILKLVGSIRHRNPFPSYLFPGFHPIPARTLAGSWGASRNLG